MDFKELDVSVEGNCYALVFQDYSTKWLEVFAVKDRTAPTVTKCLAELVWRHSVPTKIIHDRTTEFYRMSCKTQLRLPTFGGHPQTAAWLRDSTGL